MDNDAELQHALNLLETQSPSSPWRLKALVAGGNYFLVSNRADEYLPLYRAVYQDFPDDAAAALSHWKVAFDAYLHRRTEGFRVHGAALSGKAAEGLLESSGIASRTLASWDYGWQAGRGELGSRDILVIDKVKANKNPECKICGEKPTITQLVDE